MPTLFLGTRRTDLVELMDSPSCDPDLLSRTFDQFARVNRLVAGWGSVYRRWIRPRLALGPATLLDIGCGGADVPRYLLARAASDGFSLAITGIDPDARAIAFARSRSPDIELQACHSSALVSQNRRFDFVVSNHVLHHLGAEERARLFADSEALATHRCLHCDIRRDDLAYAGFSLLGLGFRGSFIRPDGLTSIRRSYTADELAAVLPPAWESVPVGFFRLAAVLSR